MNGLVRTVESGALTAILTSKLKLTHAMIIFVVSFYRINFKIIDFSTAIGVSDLSRIGLRNIGLGEVETHAGLRQLV